MFFSRASLLSVLVASPSFANAATSSAFSYDFNEANGPQNWGSLDIDGNQCDGQKNSPIAVTTGACDRWGNYRFSSGTCSTSDLAYSLTTTGVKAAFPSEGCDLPTVDIPGVDGIYRALQFHIHTSSEHTIDGKFFGAELHIVHSNEDGTRFAVVGMMIEPDNDMENELFGQLLDGWQLAMDAGDSACAIERSGSRKLFEQIRPNPERRLQAFSPYDLLPDDITFYHYDGGLTTPPCSEVVWWNLADKPVSIAPSQYHQLVNQVLNYIDTATCTPGTYAGHRGITSRPVQELHGRTVERVCPAGFGFGVDEDNVDCVENLPESDSVDEPSSSSMDTGDESSAASYSVLLLGVVSAAVSAALF